MELIGNIPASSVNIEKEETFGIESLRFNNSPTKHAEHNIIKMM